MSFKKPVEHQRMRYWQGQLLRSRDFRDQRTGEDHVRWWHNRAVHQSFGIADGFEVQMHDGTAVCGDTPFPNKPKAPAVVICPGVAFDCFGRELLLFYPEIVPLPATFDKRGVTLLAHYRETGETAKPAVCLPGSAPSQVERPLFHWKPAYLVTPADGVVLAEFDGDGALIAGKVLAYARGEKRPLIANGATLPGSTAWKVWQESIQFDATVPVGIEVEIDTSAAGFTETPCYFAWLSGSLWSQDLVEKLVAGSSAAKTPALDYQKVVTGILLLQMFAVRTDHIHAATQTQFTFRLWLPHAATRFSKGGDMSELLAIARKQQLSVCWLGIQPNSTL